MRPLPRLLAFSDDRIAALEDFGIRAAAIAAAGPAVALVARLPAANTDQLATFALRCVALARPPEASVFVTGRADVAMAVGASGVILRKNDLAIADVRAATGKDRTLFVLRSIHTEHDAEVAIGEGADGVILGSIWESASHPGQAGTGLELLERVAAHGVPTFAIGGVTAARAAEARDAGAWGVAAITALWDAADPYAAARAMLAPWQKAESGAAPCN